MGDDLQRVARLIIPGYRRLWRYRRESDEALIVFLTDALPTTASVDLVHDMGRAVGLRRQGEYWLKYKAVSKSWSKAGRADRQLFSDLDTIGRIPF